MLGINLIFYDAVCLKHQINLSARNVLTTALCFQLSWVQTSVRSIKLSSEINVFKNFFLSYGSVKSEGQQAARQKG